MLQVRLDFVKQYGCGDLALCVTTTIYLLHGIDCTEFVFPPQAGWVVQMDGCSTPSRVIDSHPRTTEGGAFLALNLVTSCLVNLAR